MKLTTLREQEDSLRSSCKTKLCRSKRRLSSVVTLFCGCTSLIGCFLFVPDIHDLRLVDVQPVEVGALDLHDDTGNLRPKLPPIYVVGKISIATKVDIHGIAEDSDANILPILTICKTGALVINFGGVYFKDVDLNYRLSTSSIALLYKERAKSHRDDEPYVYDIYFDPRSNRKESAGPGQIYAFEPFDFAQMPLDLCLRINGGNMGGGHFTSNTVVIPSVELARAFQTGIR